MQATPLILESIFLLNGVLCNRAIEYQKILFVGELDTSSIEALGRDRILYRIILQSFKNKQAFGLSDYHGYDGIATKFWKFLQLRKCCNQSGSS